LAGSANTNGSNQITIQIPANDIPDHGIVNWGDGTTQQYAVSPSAPPSTSIAATHSYELTGTYSIGLTAVDEDGSTATSAAVTVAPVAPTLTLNPVTTVPQGTISDLTGIIGEPGLLENVSVSISWGDGSLPTVIPVQASQPQIAATHQYAVAGSYTITGTVTDSSGQQGNATVGAAVTPPAPAIASAHFTTASIPVGGLVTVIPGVSGQPPATVVTPAVLVGTIAPSLAADTDTVSVAWGDGTTSAATVNNTDHTFSATHIYLSSSFI
jgi:hypothetical protein